MKRLEWEHQSNLDIMDEDMLKDRLEWLKDRRSKLMKSLISIGMEIEETKDAIKRKV